MTSFIHSLLGEMWSSLPVPENSETVWRYAVIPGNNLLHGTASKPVPANQGQFSSLCKEGEKEKEKKSYKTR